jgi:hypothetical protein
MVPHLNKEQNVKFRSILKRVKVKFPPAYPVTIRTKKKTKTSKNFGLTEFLGSKQPYFRITLSQEPYEILVDTFLHEYAHVLAWNLRNITQDVSKWHDESWAVEYSKLYRFIIEPKEPE